MSIVWIPLLTSVIYVASAFGWSQALRTPFERDDVVTIALFSFGGAITALAIGQM